MGELVGELEEALGRVREQVVLAIAQAVVRAERLGDHEVPGGEPQHHAVLERRVGVVVEVQLHVGAREESHQPLAGEAVADVHDLVRALDRREQAFAVGCGAPDEENARGPASRRDVAVDAVGDRDGERSPHREHRARCLCDQWVERDDAVEVRRVDLFEPLHALTQVVVCPAALAGQGLGEVAERECAKAMEESAGDDLWPEHEHYVRVALLQLREQRLGRRARAEVDEAGLDAVGGLLERALREEHALPHEHHAQWRRHYSCSAT